MFLSDETAKIKNNFSILILTFTSTKILTKNKEYSIGNTDGEVFFMFLFDAFPLPCSIILNFLFWFCLSLLIVLEAAIALKSAQQSAGGLLEGEDDEGDDDFDFK